MVKNLPPNAGYVRDVGSVPRLGRSPHEHTLWHRYADIHIVAYIGDTYYSIYRLFKLVQYRRHTLKSHNNP